MALIRLTRKYRNDKLVAAVDWTLESFFSKPLRVSIACKEKQVWIFIYDINTSLFYTYNITNSVPIPVLIAIYYVMV